MFSVDCLCSRLYASWRCGWGMDADQVKVDLRPSRHIPSPTCGTGRLLLGCGSSAIFILPWPCIDTPDNRCAPEIEVGLTRPLLERYMRPARRETDRRCRGILPSARWCAFDSGHALLPDAPIVDHLARVGRDIPSLNQLKILQAAARVDIVVALGPSHVHPKEFSKKHAFRLHSALYLATERSILQAHYYFRKNTYALHYFARTPGHVTRQPVRRDTTRQRSRKSRNRHTVHIR